MNTMTKLDATLAKAFTNNGEKSAVNTFWIEFLRTKFFIPIDNKNTKNVKDSFQPLFAILDSRYFIAIFDTEKKFNSWRNNNQEIKAIELSGTEIIDRINDNIYISLNIGSPLYKELSPDEIKQLKKIVARLEQLKKS